MSSLHPTESGSKGVIAAVLTFAMVSKSKKTNLELDDVMRYFVRFYEILGGGMQRFETPKGKK